ncbi:hypothetical protein [Croceicoccus sp. YJ47]|uniref:hypothetical protein n=1 Tax=Croceicoccus sp. YJ47 TaxID=2798724 RepID=UPI001922A1DB|nr:hypothetical protein [Croceicoccus sp. YJ47]QQN75022.1 hypothetical protein JD971_04820 [Croceicoccus sp. YJ47]
MSGVPMTLSVSCCHCDRDDVPLGPSAICDACDDELFGNGPQNSDGEPVDQGDPATFLETYETGEYHHG